MKKHDLKLPNEPARFTKDHLDGLLIHCYQLGVSDIHFQSDDRIWAHYEGQLIPIVQRKLSHHEVVDLLHHVYGDNGNAQILSGSDVNTHYECRLDRLTRYRVRMNGTGCLVQGHAGLQLSFRIIPTAPPTLASLSLEDDLLNALMPDQGVVYVTGPTGSGKSTLLAAIIRHIAENETSHRKILTYESPIEFTYDDIEKPSVTISQSEIPRHIPSFAEGVKNALRRNPHLMIIGEAPDAQSIQAVIEAGLTGHPIYTTLHSSGVSETMRRLVNALDSKENTSQLIDIIETVKVIVWQQLVPSTQGTLIALREFLIFNEMIKNTLLETHTSKVTATTRRLLHEYGQPIYIDARRKFKEGKISVQTLKRFEDRYYV